MVGGILRKMLLTLPFIVCKAMSRNRGSPDVCGLFVCLSRRLSVRVLHTRPNQTKYSS